MPLYKGNTKIGAIYKGTTPISAIYKGSTLIFSSYTWQEWYVEYVYNTLVPQTLPKNLYNGTWEVGTIYQGEDYSSTNALRTPANDKIKVSGGTTYYLVGTNPSTSTNSYVFEYDENGTWIDRLDNVNSNVNNTLSFQLNANCKFVRLVVNINTTNVKFYKTNANVLDKAKVSTIYGNSVVENQLVVNGNFEDSNGWGGNSGAGNFSTISVSNNVLTQTYNSTPDAEYKSGIIQVGSGLYKQTYANHYYLAHCKFKSSVACSVRMYMESAGYFTNLSVPANQWVSYSFVKQATQNKTQNYVFVNISSATILSNGDTLQFAEVEVIDLTQMFPFNTPTTLTDTRVQAILNRGYIAHNSGELKSVDMSEVSSTNADTTPLQTLSLKYQGGGVNTSHDTMVIDNDNVVFTKAMNRVDLGTLIWYARNSDDRYGCAYAYPTNFKYPSSNNNVANMCCSNYLTTSFQNLFYTEGSSTTFKGIASSIANLEIKDPTFRNYTGEQIKTALSGVMLEYQLATPQVITIPKKHIGVVDLGSLSWEAQGSSRFISKTIESVIKPVATTSTQANVYCSIYQTTSYTNLNNDFAVAVYTNGRLYIKDTSKGTLTGEQFKNSLAGQYLYYETTDESTIPNIIGVQGGGTITTNSEVLPNIDFEVKAK